MDFVIYDWNVLLIYFLPYCLFSLLVECFTKYCVVREAIRHFRALKHFEEGTKVLHDEGNHGDPLSLYLRALCREGIILLAVYF